MNNTVALRHFDVVICRIFLHKRTRCSFMYDMDEPHQLSNRCNSELLDSRKYAKAADGNDNNSFGEYDCIAWTQAFARNMVIYPNKHMAGKNNQWIWFIDVPCTLLMFVPVGKMKWGAVIRLFYRVLWMETRHNDIISTGIYMIYWIYMLMEWYLISSVVIKGEAPSLARFWY